MSTSPRHSHTFLCNRCIISDLCSFSALPYSLFFNSLCGPIVIIEDGELLMLMLQWMVDDPRIWSRFLLVLCRVSSGNSQDRFQIQQHSCSVLLKLTENTAVHVFTLTFSGVSLFFPEIQDGLPSSHSGGRAFSYAGVWFRVMDVFSSDIS